MEEHLFQIDYASPGWRFGDDNHELLGNRSYEQLNQTLPPLARVEFLQATKSVGKLVSDGQGGRTRQTAEGSLNQANYALEAAGSATIQSLRESAFYVSHLDSRIQIFQLQLSHTALQTLASLDLLPTDSVAHLGGLIWSELYDQTNSWKEILEICHALYDWLPWLLEEGFELQIDDDLATLGRKIAEQATSAAGFGNHATLNWAGLLPARFGWGVKKMTLDQLGVQVGKTRERVRQVEKIILSHLKNTAKTYHPALQAILEHEVTSHKNEITDALRSDAINISEDWTDKGLGQLFESFGLTEEYQDWFEANKITPDHRATSAAIDKAIRKARTDLGTLKLTTIRFPVSQDVIPMELVRERIKAIYTVHQLDGDYALVSQRGTMGVISESGHQLFVSSPLSLDVLAQGLNRVAKFRKCAALMPPTAVLGRLLEMAGMTKNDQGLFTGPKQALTEDSLHSWLYNFVLNSTNHIASKATIFRAASKVGLSINTLGLYLSYLSWIRPLGEGLFTLVGQTPSVAAIDFAHRVDQANYISNKNASYSVSPDGAFIYVDVYFSTPLLISGIISINSDLSEILGEVDRKISCCQNFESEAKAKTRQTAWHGFAGLRQHLIQDHSIEESDTINLKVDNQLVRVIH